MLSNVRIFLHGAKVNVLENLLNISLTVECVLIVATCHKNHKSISGELVSGKIFKFHTFSASCNNDKLYCQGKHLFLDCFLFLSFTGHKCRNGSSNKIWQMLQNVNTNLTCFSTLHRVSSQFSSWSTHLYYQGYKNNFSNSRHHMITFWRTWT